MKERKNTERPVTVKIIYDKDGRPIGVSTTDASLDWRDAQENTVIVIKPKNNDSK